VFDLVGVETYEARAEGEEAAFDCFGVAFEGGLAPALRERAGLA
jgi:hypothetical protein